MTDVTFVGNMFLDWNEPTILLCKLLVQTIFEILEQLQKDKSWGPYNI